MLRALQTLMYSLRVQGPVYPDVKIDGRLEKDGGDLSYERGCAHGETAGPLSDAEKRKRQQQAEMASKPAPKATACSLASPPRPPLLQPRRSARGARSIMSPSTSLSRKPCRSLARLWACAWFRGRVSAAISASDILRANSAADGRAGAGVWSFWFADGGVVYAETLQDQKTRIVPLKNIGASQLF